MIHWNISGAIVHRNVILPFVDRLGLKDVCLQVHDGVPGLAWSGGRNQAGTLDPAVLDDAIEQYGRRNIGINLLCSNHLLTPGDVSSEYGNALLDRLHDARNGVVVCDGVLADHVRANYPKYRLVRSVIASYLDRVIDRPPGAIVRYFEQKTQQYDVVVVPTELNLRFDILDKLDKSKLEFLANNGCFWHCPLRSKHYDAIASAFRSAEGSPARGPCLTKDALSGHNERILDYLLKHDGVLDGAGARLKRLKPGHRFVVRKSVMTYEQIATMQTRGCTRFKLQGRDYPAEQFARILDDYIVAYDSA